MGVDIRIPIADDFDGIEWWWTMIDDDCSDYCCETAGEQGVSVTNEEGRWITTVTTEVSRLIYGEEQLRRVVFLLFFFFFFFFTTFSSTSYGSLEFSLAAMVRFAGTVGDLNAASSSRDCDS